MLIDRRNDTPSTKQMKIDTRRICVKVFNIEVGQFFVIRMLILIVQNLVKFLVKINAINVFRN